ncbi:MAG TPA: hypothetical protein VNQ90_01430 [Chthoniobacteraceae bacterium]|nr:hypothetical protein [Chthoniobacteraceae bacterium]
MKRSLLSALALCTLGALSPHALGDPYTPEYTQGNTFRYRTSSNQTSNTLNGAYVRFTATETTSATSLSVNLNNDATAASLTFGLQADDGNGKPTGTFLASGTATVTPGGWSTITFAEQPLVAGQVYHVVVQPTTAGNATLRKLVTDGVTPDQTYGIVDHQYGWGVMTGGTTPGATNTSDVITFAVGTTSGRGMGYALIDSQFSPFLSQTTPYAQRFEFKSGEPGHTALDSITLRLNVGETNLRDVQVTLLNDANVTLATTVLDSSLLTPGGTNFYTLSFEETPILTEGAYYKIALTSAEAGTSSVRWFGYISKSTNDAVNSATFQGLDGYALIYGDAAFSSISSTDMSKDYNFSYTTAAVIPEPGTTALAVMALVLTIGMLRRRSSPLSH